MKKVFLLAGALAVSSSGLFAQVPVARAVGDLTTIGGWDFNGGTATTVATVNARYNQAYTNYFTAGTVTAPGSAAYNAVASFTGVNGATFASNRGLNSTQATPYDLLSTVGLLGSNNSLGDNSGNARAVTLSNTSTLDNARATFKVETANSLNSFENIQLQYSARNLGTASADIGFSYSLDGINFTALAGSTQTWSNAATFAVSNLIDFSSITALNGQSAIWIGLNYSESAASASVLLDNVAIYGTATAIPEPSTYAAIIAALTMGVVAIRRRKAVVVA